MKKIEEKLDQVYNFTVDYINENGFPPSVREICTKLNIKSTATAYSYIERLKEKGLLNKAPSKKRALTLSQNHSARSIPLLGVVRAGSPIFAVENLDGYIPLPEEFDDGSDFFALHVEGDSMIKAGICEGDVIIVRKACTAVNGEIVVALVEDSATVKRFFKRDNKVILHPENDELDDMIFDDVSILGTVKGLIRKF